MEPPVHVSAKHRMVCVPASDNRVAGIFPDAKNFAREGCIYSVVKHGIAETKVLRSLGYNIPAPFETQYEFGQIKPFRVQIDTCNMLTMNDRAYVLNGLGTGKTKAALWSYDYLRSKFLATKMLVVAPLSTVHNVWAREVFETIPHRKVAVLHGPKAKRIEKLKDKTVDIFVINHDGIKVLQDELQALIDAKTINVICIDELAVYRSEKSDRAYVMAQLAKKCDTVWGMTGTPIPNGPCDVWSQCRIVTPTTVAPRYGTFKASMMVKVTQFKWEPKPDAIQRAFECMQPAVRFTLDDVIELPECVERMQDVTLGSKQHTVYTKLKKAASIAFEKHEITAVNAGAALNKMLQVSCGWVYAQDGKVAALDPDDRLQALTDIIDAADHKLLVFVSFKHALAGISASLNKAGVEHATVSGDTSLKERTDTFRLFQSTSKYKVILAHPACMAHGITLTAADTVVWYSPVLSNEIYEQACGRVRRIGQKHRQQIIHLQATAVEKRAYAMLQQKRRVQANLLELFEEATNAAV